MHFYATDYGALMAMPMVTFWELSKNVERIRAEEDMRFIRSVGSMFSDDSNHYDTLAKSLGDIVEVEESVVVNEGIMQLRGLIGGIDGFRTN